MLTLQLANAFVAVDSHDEHIAQRPRRFQAANVPRMQQIEAAVGEHNALPVAFPFRKPQNRLFQCQYCWVQRVSMFTPTLRLALRTEKEVYHAILGVSSKPALIYPMVCG